MDKNDKRKGRDNGVRFERPKKKEYSDEAKALINITQQNKYLLEQNEKIIDLLSNIDCNIKKGKGI
tara:strand:+ start:3541 stop:3738 length:198 start_codon:yes stop_codon:yes gene_type:complete